MLFENLRSIYENFRTLPEISPQFSEGVPKMSDFMNYITELLIILLYQRRAT